MTGPNKNYTVIREYQCLYDVEELVRRIIRYHMRDVCDEKELSEHKKGEADSYGECNG